MSSPATRLDAMPSATAPTRAPRRDRRRVALAALPVLLAMIALAVMQLPGRGVDAERLADRALREKDNGFAGLKDRGGKPTAGEQQPEAPLRGRDANAQILEAARKLLNDGRHDEAIQLINRNHGSLRERPEAYLLLGRALEGKRDHATARDFYLAALDRDPMLADAYWGVATSSENLGDLEFALGAMRSYLHVEPDLDPGRLRINQARSAIWEWESQLGRDEWGPTKGIPPGFSAEELKRDGRGVAVKMPLEESKQPDGSMKYEIKHAEKIQIYPRP